MSGLKIPDSDRVQDLSLYRHYVNGSSTGLQPRSSNLNDLIASVEGKMKDLKGDASGADKIDAARLRQDIGGGKFSGLA